MNLLRAAFGGLLGSLCLVCLQGCSGNGQGLDANGRPQTGGGTNLPLSDDFASIQANVFTPICTKCHIGGGAPEGLRLDAANSYNLLVGVPSTEVPSLFRVKAGDPDSSYIIQKLEGHAAVGAQMPFGGPYLSTTTIGFIRQWISNGAPPASPASTPMSTATSAALAVRTIIPGAGETLSASPPQIAVSFNREIDVTQLGLITAHLEMSGRGGETTPIELAAKVTAARGNGALLLFTPLTKLGSGHYQLILRSSITPAVSDLEGHMLALGTQRAPGESVLTQFDVEVLP
jgi:hypothetical protein